MLKRHQIPLATTFFILLLITLLAQGASWMERADTPKAGGYGQAVIGTGEEIYIVRQRVVGEAPFFWRYDPQANQWTELSLEGLPKDPFRNGTALAWDYNNHIYALLGACYKDTNRRFFYRYSLASSKWERLADTPGPQGAGNAITWSGYDGYLYALIGSNKHGTVFARYDIKKNTWKKLSFHLEWENTDDGAALVWAGDEHLYALNGEFDEDIPNGNFARYHIPTDTWESLTPLPYPTQGGVGDGGSLLWIGRWMDEEQDYIYALSGGSVDENPGVGFYRYSISQNDWEELEPIPFPIGFYNGNRLGFAQGHIYYWQGSPTTDRWRCKDGTKGGRKFFRYEIP